MANIRSIRSILVSLVSVLFICGLAAPIAAADGGRTDSSSRPDLFEVGRPVPPIVLPSAADGRPLSLADFRGRKTILHVFASW